ncbi:MAG TPA: hypothetical protein VMV32_05010 [Ignavibacteriaceae bacterium]|nr:hypothetical protein [Ignavibacteriaceae bacterium]
MKPAFLIVISIFFICSAMGQVPVEKTLTTSVSTDTTAFNSAGADTDSVNIAQMVASQVEAARKKEELNTYTQVADVKTQIPKSNNLGLLNIYKEIESRLSIPEDVMMKASILISASFLSTAVIFVRRRKMKRKKQPANKNLKDNIKSLREEKIQIKGNSKLSSVRNRLTENATAYNLNQEDASRTAKKLNISTEEILLAQRLKRMH